jgi:hypothetical protein
MSAQPSLSDSVNPASSVLAIRGNHFVGPSAGSGVTIGRWLTDMVSDSSRETPLRVTIIGPI